MGKRSLGRELPRFKIEVNGFIIRYYGVIKEKQKVEFIAEVTRPGPVMYVAMELKEVNLSLLILESIEWTFNYKQGRNESNNGTYRYSKRALPESGRDSLPLDEILRRGVDYKHNPGQYQ